MSLVLCYFLSLGSSELRQPIVKKLILIQHIMVYQLLWQMVE